jgi:hypothetical protein
VGESRRRHSGQFFAGAVLVLLDQVLRSGADVSSAGKSHVQHRAEPNFIGALRQRLALRAATAYAKMLRLREEETALRDAEHLAAQDPTKNCATRTPGARVHRLWRLLAAPSLRLVARQSGWKRCGEQDGQFGGRGEEMIVVPRQ